MPATWSILIHWRHFYGSWSRERERETLRQRPLQVFLITYKKMQKLLIHRQWSLLLQCIWKQMVFLMKCRPDQTRTEMTEEEEKTGKTIIKFPKKKWKKNDGKLGTRWKTYRLISNLTRGWNWCLECIRSPHQQLQAFLIAEIFCCKFFQQMANSQVWICNGAQHKIHGATQIYCKGEEEGSCGFWFQS